MTKLSDTQKLILALLSKALFERKVFLPENIEWDTLYKEAVDQTVLPLVYKSVTEIMPPGVKAEWQKSVYQMLANNIQVLHEHKEVHKVLSEGKIPYVIIKGAASAKYYPDPKHRIMGDVDFIVQKIDLNRAGKLLEKKGFNCTEDREHPAHLAYYRGSSIWEMHWSMSGIPTGENGAVTRKLFSEIIGTAVFDPDGYNIPDEFHHGLVMLIHIAEHLVNTGIGLRHLCDWAVFEERFSDEEFREVFEVKLKSCGLWRFAQLLTQLCVIFLGATKKSWADEKIDKSYLNKLIIDIFDGGNFGRKDSERINQAKLYTNQGKGFIGDKGTIVQLMQTMNEKSERALPEIKRMPLLLPFGWFYVGVRHLIRIRKGIRPNMHVKKMIEGAKERRKLYKEFHLFEK